MVSSNFSVGVSPDLLKVFDEKRGNISRSSIISKIMKMWIDGKVEINIEDETTISLMDEPKSEPEVTQDDQKENDKGHY